MVHELDYRNIRGWTDLIAEKAQPQKTETEMTTM
jgi:hypothetical protein